MARLFCFRAHPVFRFVEELQRELSRPEIVPLAVLVVNRERFDRVLPQGLQQALPARALTKTDTSALLEIEEPAPALGGLDEPAIPAQPQSEPVDGFGANLDMRRRIVGSEPPVFVQLHSRPTGEAPLTGEAVRLMLRSGATQAGIRATIRQHGLRQHRGQPRRAQRLAGAAEAPRRLDDPDQPSALPRPVRRSWGEL